MQFHLILLTVFFWYLYRKSKQDREFFGWRIWGIIGFVASIALTIVDGVLQKKPNIYLFFVVYPTVIAFIFLIFKRRKFHSLKSRLFIFLPLMSVGFAVDLLKLISDSLAKQLAPYFVTGSVFSLIWLAVAAYLNNKQQKALKKERQITEDKEKELRITEKVMSQLEEQVAERTAALRMQKEELENAIQQLHSTQVQLVHAEKMASLGELTAGIAHEIQNPLNFVNNFSDLSKELVDEMNAELDKGDIEEAKFIASDIKQNLEKINYHGKRAESIVTGMLQHSRTSSGEKQPTDINKLADEYLRLSYHGMRSKDKSFNADIVTDFDERLSADEAGVGNINIAPQEIGRVILNLVNNAFYAVNEKSKLPNEGYKPTVTVITKKENNTISISVADNGNGIPEKIKEKIFNPFFTTKPTGLGTGLGLSLSYDIVKAHGGEINMQSKDGAGTAFTIQLPIF